VINRRRCLKPERKLSLLLLLPKREEFTDTSMRAGSIFGDAMNKSQHSHQKFYTWNMPNPPERVHVLNRSLEMQVSFMFFLGFTSS
jgi:hypothetical protein